MNTLKLKEFRCIDETNEWTPSDSPYFVVFIGHPVFNKATSDVKVLRNPAWDNEVDAGELWAANMTVANNVTTGTLVLVALLEEDDGPDFTGDALTNLRNWMQGFFQGPGSAGGATVKDLTGKMKSHFEEALEEWGYNDDCLGVLPLTITTTTGLLPLLHFQGDGGAYRVRFEMV